MNNDFYILLARIVKARTETEGFAMYIELVNMLRRTELDYIILE